MSEFFFLKFDYSQLRSSCHKNEAENLNKEQIIIKAK